MTRLTKALLLQETSDAYRRGFNDGERAAAKKFADDLRAKDRAAYTAVMESMAKSLTAMSQAMNAVSNTADSWRPV